MRHILVTGGLGTVGSGLTAVLAAEKGTAVTVLDDGSSGANAVPRGVRLVRGDVADERLLDRVLRTPFREIYHLAAFFANQNSCDHPLRDFRTNALGTVLLFEKAARLKGLKTVLFASTSSMQGDLDAGLDEGFSTPYMASKFVGELYGRFFRRTTRLPLRVVRYYNGYGPGELPGRYRNVIINFIDLSLRGKPLPITGDGSETRDFTYVDDLVAGSLKVARSPRTLKGYYPIGTGRETRIRDLAAAINRLTGNTAGLRRLPRRAWDRSMRRRADLGPARRDAGYRPTVALEEGLRRTIEWYRLERSARAAG